MWACKALLLLYGAVHLARACTCSQQLTTMLFAWLEPMCVVHVKQYPPVFDQCGCSSTWVRLCMYCRCDPVDVDIASPPRYSAPGST